MGISGISTWQILILLLIVLLVFGTKKLRNVGGDLGTAIRDFRKGMSESDSDGETKPSASESVEKSESAEDEDTPKVTESSPSKS